MQLFTGIFSRILLKFLVIFSRILKNQEQLFSRNTFQWLLLKNGKANQLTGFYTTRFLLNGISKQTIIQKQPLEVFYKNRYLAKRFPQYNCSWKILEKIHVTILIFNFSKVAALQPSKFLRNELFLRYFSRILNTGRKQPFRAVLVKRCS